MPNLPTVVDRATFQAELDALRVKEKAHTKAGDALAAQRRRLPMVEVGASLELIGPNGPLTLLDAFEGRKLLIAYYFMWNAGAPAPEQCEGCTWCAGEVGELSYLNSRDITYAVICQGPYAEGGRPPPGGAVGPRRGGPHLLVSRPDPRSGSSAVRSGRTARPRARPARSARTARRSRSRPCSGRGCPATPADRS